MLAAEIVGSALDRTMPPSAQTNGERVDGMMGGAEGAEAVEGQIRPGCSGFVVKSRGGREEAGEKFIPS